MAAAEADAAARATTEEEAIYTRSVKKRQPRNMRALTPIEEEAMAVLPPKEEKEDSSHGEQIRSIHVASLTGTSTRRTRIRREG